VYAATDHLDSPLHMVSAIAVAGRIGLTAIGDTLDEARQRYHGVKAAVDVAASHASSCAVDAQA
jgi:hypothetical protein